MGNLEFAGNGKMDVGDGSMKDIASPGLQSGGPVEFADGDKGMTADGNVVNTEGSVPGGSGVQFTMGNDW
jgi:hypothetical protein